DGAGAVGRRDLRGDGVCRGAAAHRVRDPARARRLAARSGPPGRPAQPAADRDRHRPRRGRRVAHLVAARRSGPGRARHRSARLRRYRRDSRSRRDGRLRRAGPARHARRSQRRAARQLRRPRMSSIRYSIRTLLKTPGFTVIAVVTIALGIAANTAIFSIVNGVLLRPLPFRDEGRVVKVSTTSKDERESNHSAGDYMDLRQNNRSLESIAGYREDVVAITTGSREPAQFEGAWVTSEYFEVLGTPPALGRTFTRGDNTGRGDKLIVLGHEAWQKLFANDPGAPGRSVRVNGQAYTVAAVMPRGFAWPQGAKAWLLSPLAVPPSPIELKDPETNRDVQYFQAIARLKSGVTMAQAAEDLHNVGADIQQKHGDTSGGRDVRIQPIRETLVGDIRDALMLIQGAVGLVLLIACANVSSLLIARATGRRRELAIRAALGASRGQLIRQLPTESLVLGMAGGITGLLMSSWLVTVLVSLLPSSVPRADAIALDTTVLVVTLGASVLTGVLFGILPAMQA